MHDFNAAWRDADHIHEGLGFLPQHMKMTNIFELAMQAVDPSVSLFFWDFTIESAGGIDLADSPMFQEDTFGELALATDSVWGWTYRNNSIYDAVVKNGKWKRTKAESNYDFTELKSGYGYMRGPWNMNPSPLITRFYTTGSAIPSCSSYYSWLSLDTFQEFMMESENGPHGSVHGSIGGVFGCDVMDEMLSRGLLKDESAQRSVCAKWGFYIKEMYRGSYLSPVEDCELDTNDLEGESGTHCGFVCDDALADDHIYMMQNSINLGNFVPDDMDDDGWVAWRDFLCTGNGYRVFVGDHLESASPLDPSFWPIHPTQERLLQLKYMVTGFPDDTVWPTTATEKGVWVCNHNQCSNYKDSSAEKDYYSECCRGHYEYDRLMDFTTFNRSLSYGDSNHDILAAADPRADYSLPYIYSNFYMNHCDQDLNSLISDLMAAA